MKPIRVIFVSAMFFLTQLGIAQAQGIGPPPAKVNVINTPDVNIINPTLDVTVKGFREGRPYSKDVVGTCNDKNCFFNTFPQVPDGKMLVIMHISVLVRPLSSTTVVDFAQLVTSDTEEPGIGARNYFPMTRIGQAGVSVIYDSWATNAPVRAYVRQGEAPSISSYSSVGGGFAFATATIAGYVIDFNL